jgi:general secretion pathway protein N
MKRRWLVALALLSFLLTLVLHAPAPLLHAWVATPGGGTAVHGLHGTLAEGGFAALTVNQRPVLGESRWRLQPAWLALLRLSAELETAGDPVIRVGVSRGLFGPLRLSNLAAAGSVRSLLGSMGQPLLPVEGRARLDFALIRVQHGLPVEARGTAEVADLEWVLARDPLPLGSFSAVLDTDDKGITARLAGGDGPLELSGTATLAPDRSYDVRLQLRPRPAAPPQLQALVRSLGQPDAQGWYHLRRNGSLAAPA